MLRLSVPDKDGIVVLCNVVRLCINPEKDKRSAMAEVARTMSACHRFVAQGLGIIPCGGMNLR
jgi:hypothetical protein